MRLFSQSYSTLPPISIMEAGSKRRQEQSRHEPEEAYEVGIEAVDKGRQPTDAKSPKLELAAPCPNPGLPPDAADMDVVSVPGPPVGLAGCTLLDAHTKLFLYHSLSVPSSGTGRRGRGRGGGGGILTFICRVPVCSILVWRSTSHPLTTFDNSSFLYRHNTAVPFVSILVSGIFSICAFSTQPSRIHPYLPLTNFPLVVVYH